MLNIGVFSKTALLADTLLPNNNEATESESLWFEQCTLDALFPNNKHFLSYETKKIERKTPSGMVKRANHTSFLSWNRNTSRESRNLYTKIQNMT